MNESFEERLVKRLIEKNYTITTAESCTGGMISSSIVNIPGASSVLNEAYVTYSNEAKHRLIGVSEETLEAYGAVSEQTAGEMAAGAARAANADCAIAVTGIAGPDGGTPEKPVGTVYAGFYAAGDIEVVRYSFAGGRLAVRKQTTDAVLAKMYELLI